MRLIGDTKIILGSIIVTIGLLVGALFLFTRPAKTFERSYLVPEGSITRGSTDALIYLVEFSDFQCPACRAFVPIVDQILETYGNDILFAYRHFPLPQHPYAIPAARAFEAAAAQGKAWEMYAYLFDNQTILSNDIIQKGAKSLQLNMEDYEKSISSQIVKNKVEKDRLDAQTLGINSTPTFFLNGQKLRLNQPNDLIVAVEQAMQKSK